MAKPRLKIVEPDSPLDETGLLLEYALAIVEALDVIQDAGANECLGEDSRVALYSLQRRVLREAQAAVSRMQQS